MDRRARTLTPEERQRKAAGVMNGFDSLTPEARALVRRWGQSAMDRITALGMSPTQAEADLKSKYREPI